NFPEFTGRICPAPCEGSCVLGINKPPVAIEHIEKSIIEKAYDMGLIKPNKSIHRNGMTVGIVGSGPAGLAAADQLNKVGYLVIVYEREQEIGGLLRFGIPDFKLEKEVVSRRVNLLAEEGIEFKTATEIGKDISFSALRSKHDAILLATGSTVPRNLSIPGREFSGVHFAMEFLTQQNKRVSAIPFNEVDILATGKDVVVIGGGDTGSDCIGTSNRHKARSIVQFEVMPTPPSSRSSANPWPEYPLVLRTSSSHDEGCDRTWSILTKEFIGNADGVITGIKTVQVKWEEGQMIEVPNSEKIYPCDLALLAIGFVHTEQEHIKSQLQVGFDARGNIDANNYQTKLKNVFAAGDNRRGQSLVVWAISEGREAARQIDLFLRDETDLPIKSKSEYDLINTQ
ncbi:MAG: glutamate synthase (NADPH/NADH) small chain, partial [Cyclobacteriaceae bacterium]